MRVSGCEISVIVEKLSLSCIFGGWRSISTFPRNQTCKTGKVGYYSGRFTDGALFEFVYLAIYIEE